MTECAAVGNANPTASVFKAAILETVSEENGFKNEIPQQAKDKAHCFCPLLAKEHGEEAAVILQGLGYKIARSKKIKEGRRWHFDTLEALEKRWPYLRDSGIHGIIERLNGKIVKGRFNKEWWRDRTTWYSMTEALIERALESEGKFWFDVSVAVQLGSIVAGTLYQNLRFQLLLQLVDHPKGVPYHKVNKTALARVLPWSLSTIKRWYVAMVEAGLIAENPLCSGEYTILNPADIIVPEGMNGRSVAEKTGSSTEKTRSHTEMTGSSTEMTGSTAEDITHYKPFQKHIHNTHSLTAPPSCVSGCPNAADAAEKVHQQNSCTVPVAERGLNLQSIRNLITTLEGQVSVTELEGISGPPSSFALVFITEELSIDTLRAIHAAKVSETIIAAVLPSLRTMMQEHGTNSGWTPAGCDLATHRVLEIIVGAFLVNAERGKRYLPEFKHCWDQVWQTYLEIPLLGNHPHATAKDKADSLIMEIQNSNSAGWPTYSSGNIEFKVAASSAVHKAAVEFFNGHEDLSTHDVWKALSDCIEVHQLNHPPDGFDPLWKSRRGISPNFLLKFWDDIQAELNSVDTLIT